MVVHSIQPFNYIGPIKTIIKVEISVIKLVLFQSVDILVQYFDENDNIVENEYLTISGQDYSSWSSDDNYILEYVASKTGVHFCA